MKRRSGVTTLRAIARKDWDAGNERPFGRIGVNHLLVCALADELLADDVDAAEVAHRWNAYPILVAALQLIARTADSVHRARAAANDALLTMPGGTNSRSSGR